MTIGIALATALAILKVYNNTTYTAIASVTAKLHVGDPGGAGTANPSAGSVATNAITWVTPTTPTMTMASLGAFTNAGATETVSHISLWNGGTFLQSIALATPQAWVTTNTLTITSLALSYTPIAA